MNTANFAQVAYDTPANMEAATKILLQKGIMARYEDKVHLSEKIRLSETFLTQHQELLRNNKRKYFEIIFSDNVVAIKLIEGDFSKKFKEDNDFTKNIKRMDMMYDPNQVVPLLLVNIDPFCMMVTLNSLPWQNCEVCACCGSVVCGNI